jgi:ATP-dependent exoDNAse (exonuclease V) beta subunit
VKEYYERQIALYRLALERDFAQEVASAECVYLLDVA